MPSKYNDFVSRHIRSAPGANQKEKMRAVAAAWRKHKAAGGHHGGAATAPARRRARVVAPAAGELFKGGGLDEYTLGANQLGGSFLANSESAT